MQMYALEPRGHFRPKFLEMFGKWETPTFVFQEVPRMVTEMKDEVM